MDERISSFIEDIKKLLEGLPEQEINGAVNYYEEYLNDAYEAEKDLDEVLGELGTPEKIAGMIRAETSIMKAQRSPGLKNFSGALKSAFHGVTRPLSIFLLSIFVIISFSIVAMLYAGALVTLVGAIVIGMGLIYEAFKIPFRFIIDIIGALGMASFAAGILFLPAFGLYKLGRLMVRVSIRKIRWIQGDSKKPMPKMGKGEPRKKVNNKKVVLVCLVISAVGLVLFSVSGLPVKYFTIFNSMKAENINIKTSEFDPQEINKISITTAHSCIRVLRNSSDKIIVSYEQPDWLDYEMGISGSMLSFYEKSNGRLPLFRLSTLHESRTDLTISIPEKCSPELINIETIGGYVYITDVDENIKVKTYSGNIFVKSNGLADNINITGDTWGGIIQVDGVDAGQTTNKGIEYYKNVQAKKTIELNSSRGNINIE